LEAIIKCGKTGAIAYSACSWKADFVCEAILIELPYVGAVSKSRRVNKWILFDESSNGIIEELAGWGTGLRFGPRRLDHWQIIRIEQEHQSKQCTTDDVRTAVI
jgi:hypothetical protein